MLIRIFLRGGMLIMPEKWERWNREELAILKKHYPFMSRDELMELLPGRTWRAICHIAEKRGIHREHYGIRRSEQFLKDLHDKLSIARENRKPFAGCQHSPEAKLRISVSNLFTHGYGIKDIAKRKGITGKEVERIIKNRSKNKK